MSRGTEEYVRCIRFNYGSNTQDQSAPWSWCGKRITEGFKFLDLEHAAFTGAKGDRLVACSECVRLAVACLTAINGVPDFEMHPYIMEEAEKK